MKTNEEIEIREIIKCKNCGHKLMVYPFTEPEHQPMHMIEVFLVEPKQLSYVKQIVCNAIYYSYLCMNEGCDCDKPLPDYNTERIAN